MMALRAPSPRNLRYGSRIVTAPDVEPVWPQELRAHLRADDASLPAVEADDLIAQARQFIEDETGLAMITQTWRIAIDMWPAGRGAWWDGVRQGSIADMYASGGSTSLELPRFPLISIDGVTVYSEDGTPTAVTVADTFDVDTYGIPGRMTLKRGATWPIALRAINAIEITYSAGYGQVEDVPAPLKKAVIDMAGFMYEHRGECAADDAYVKSGAASIVSRYRAARL